MPERVQEIALMLSEGVAYSEAMEIWYRTLACTIQGPGAPVVSYFFKRWAYKIEVYSKRVRCFISRALGERPIITVKDPKELGVYETESVEEAVSQMLVCEKRVLEHVKNVYERILECREDLALHHSYHLAEHLGRHVLMQQERHIAWLHSLVSGSSQWDSNHSNLC
eukprot:m51a1_g5509 hypothetical protein (167) ;mRNA; r:385443-386041